jgi:hypothetical protein
MAGRGRKIGIAAAAISLALAGVSLADSGSFKDSKGDVAHNPKHPGNYDIVRGKWGEAAGGEVLHVVTVRGTIANPAKPQQHSTVFPEVFFRVPGRSGKFCDYHLQPDAPHTQHNPGENERMNLYTCGNHPKFVGSGNTKLLDSHTLQYTVSAALLGGPTSYRFWYETRTDTKHGFVTADRAPSKGTEVNQLG